MSANLANHARPPQTDSVSWCDLTAVAVVSASVLILELALMRTLSISRWHHFAYLVVGMALLGFGVSGTWLGFFTPRLLPRFSSWCRGLTLILAINITLCYRLAELLPLNMRYILFSGQQLLWVLCYQALIFLPFLVAGTLIGLVILRYSPAVNLVYGANLLGSGVGPIIAVGLMVWLPPARIIQGAALIVWIAVFLWRAETNDVGVLRTAGTSFLVGALLLMDMVLLPSPMRFDSHKMLAELKRWEQQQDAQHLATRHGPRARLDIFSSPRLHYTLFAGLTAKIPPPDQSLLLADGDSVGPIFHIDNQREASILDHTPMSVAYRLKPKARVLRLGEISGVNVWLAKRVGAEQMTVAMENPQVLELLANPPLPSARQNFGETESDIHVASPRHYLEYSKEKFDVIQVVGAEGMAAGVSSLLSLHENYLFTVEGMARCLEHLAPGGVATITRGLQSPPRDNIKIFATLVAALEKMGVQRPVKHLVQLRNHLAVCTLASNAPFQLPLVKEVVRISDLLWLDIDALPELDLNNRKPFNRLVGPPGLTGSFYQLAASRILSEERERFFSDWAYNVRPATDDQPYFFDFFRWRSLARFIQSHGPYWFQRLELGYAILVIAFVQIVASAAILLLVPLFLWSRRRAHPRGRALPLGYFFLIGLAFLALEMSLMQRFTLLMGDPLLAAAGVLSSFLFFAGCGSVCGQRWPRSPIRAIAISVFGIALTGPVVLLLSSGLLEVAATWSTPARFLLTIGLIAPMAFLMGWPFPAGMRLLEKRYPALMPWAWGVNGFASVAAAPFTILLAMSFGFKRVLTFALVSYLLATVLAVKTRSGGA